LSNHPLDRQAEAVRDAMLAIAGRLDLSRPRKNPLEKTNYTNQTNADKEAQQVEDGNLRSVCVPIGRGKRTEIQGLFAIIVRAQERNRPRGVLDEHDPRLNGIIESSELAFRVHDSLPGVLRLEKKPRPVQEAYGIQKGKPTKDFGRQCLVARRLAEAGVRFNELYHGNWDHHRNLFPLLPSRCEETDLPIAAAPRPRSTRPPRRHARHLGRRIRTHPDDGG